MNHETITVNGVTLAVEEDSRLGKYVKINGRPFNIAFKDEIAEALKKNNELLTNGFTREMITQLNEDINGFPQVFPVTPDMSKGFSGVARLIMLDRYTFKDTEKKTLKVGDFVVLTVKTDPKFPARGYGVVTAIDSDEKKVSVKLDESFVGVLEDEEEIATGIVTRPLDFIDKPLEIYYEQIAKRNAKGLASVEKTEEKRAEWFDKFYDVLVSLDFVPGGRVIYGAGSETDVTFFNCYVMPYPQDSREGIGEHRNKVMEIMSRGGGRLTFL